ncbi:MAG: translation initiation factor IF-3 [Bacteroidales bacterium]|nr:translation initiation factor IF-3 [Bacteroidales bacterium]
MRPNKNDKAKQQYRVNEQIRAREVRVVGENAESSVMQTRDALRMAQQQGVDLVEISPNADPPVCRMIDYSKFLYQQKKRQKELKAKQVKVEVKEIRFGPQTDDHDYNFKLKHAKSFLTEGDKVKAYVFFRGRSILFKEQGEVLLLRFANDLEEYGKVESMPVLEGKRMIMFIAPKKVPLKKEEQELGDVELDQDNAEKAPAPAKPEKKAPKVKERREYTGPKVEGEDF